MQHVLNEHDFSSVSWLSGLELLDHANMLTSNICWISINFSCFLDLLDLKYLTILACQHLAWLVLACRFPWLDLLGLTFFLNGVTCLLDLAYLTWVIWLDLICSSAVFIFSCVYIHISRRICDGESSSGTPSSGGHKKRPSWKQVSNFWVVFNSTETSGSFHFMSYFPTTMLCSFGYPLGV